MKVPVYDHTGKNTSTQELPKALFEVKVSNQLLAQYLRVYQARKRQATSRAKTRGEIAISTAKIWRQKGTGRARHGARSAPIFVGGGVSHGPTGDQNYQLRLSQKMRRQALLGSLTHQSSKTLIITNLDKLDNKTKTLEQLVIKITGDTQKTLIVLDQPYQTLIQAAHNLQFITLTQAKRLNAYEVLAHNHLIISKDSLNQLSSPSIQTTSTQPDPKIITKSTKPSTTTKKSTK